jgi:hypothetical protein
MQWGIIVTPDQGTLQLIPMLLLYSKAHISVLHAMMATEYDDDSGCAPT